MYDHKPVVKTTRRTVRGATRIEPNLPSRVNKLETAIVLTVSTIGSVALLALGLGGFFLLAMLAG